MQSFFLTGDNLQKVDATHTVLAAQSPFILITRCQCDLLVTANSVQVISAFLKEEVSNRPRPKKNIHFSVSKPEHCECVQCYTTMTLNCQ